MKTYRKSTHRDQLYLCFSPNHSGDHKLSVVQTLHHRAKTLITKDDRQLEREHVNRAMRNYGYRQLALDQDAGQKMDTNKDSTSAVKDNTWKPWVALPYISTLDISPYEIRYITQYQNIAHIIILANTHIIETHFIGVIT